MDWLSLDLVLTIIIAGLGAVIGIIAVKYKEMLTSVQKLAEDYKAAMEDGVLSKKEKQQLAKDSLDVMLEIIAVISGLKWLSALIPTRKSGGK